MLSRLREIVELPDDLARDALDELLADAVGLSKAAAQTSKTAGSTDELQVDLKHGGTDEVFRSEPVNVAGATPADWRTNFFARDVERLRTQIERVRAAADVPGQNLIWDGRNLLSHFARLEDYLDPEIKRLCKDDLSALRAEVETVARESEITGNTKVIEEQVTQLISNASSVKGIIARIDESVSALRRMNSLSQETSRIARRGKERAARYRAQKKLAEAEVAKAGGNTRKSEKLRNEAAVILAQDWAQAFPGEKPPQNAI
jgi:hypothetical protein